MSIMISAAELHQLQHSSLVKQDIVVFDCRFSLADFAHGQKQYNESHIPGAQYLNMEEHLSGPKSDHGGRHPLPSAEQFTESMQKMGVNETSLIITYDDNRLAAASRLWWLLQYFGHDRLHILDGGLQAWKDANFSTTQEVVSRPKGDFRAKPSPGQTRDYHWIIQNLGNDKLQLIDSREAARYQGLEEPMDPLAGHIPGALNYPWQDVTNEQGFAQPEQIQKQRWQQLDTNKETLVYCGSGITASVNLLSLKLAGFNNAKLYPGSWSDWSSYSDSPLAST